jgi:hypothetical protein
MVVLKFAFCAGVLVLEWWRSGMLLFSELFWFLGASIPFVQTEKSELLYDCLNTSGWLILKKYGIFPPIRLYGVDRENITLTYLAS